MTDTTYYERPTHVWGPLWHLPSTTGVYIFTPGGRLLRLHVWALWYIWYKWEQAWWMRKKRYNRKGDT